MFRAHFDALAARASQLESEGQLAEAIALAERLVALAPLEEHAHRRLMRLHYLRNDRSGAIAAFERCERLIKDELGARPSEETLALLKTIESAAGVVVATRSSVRAAVDHPAAADDRPRDRTGSSRRSVERRQGRARGRGWRPWKVAPARGTACATRRPCRRSRASGRFDGAVFVAGALVAGDRPA